MPRAVVALLVVAACFDPPPPPGDFVESRTESFVLPEFSPPDMDLLVVIDDTAAMEPYQSHLATFALEIVAQLRRSYGMPNLHIAVTTTTSGTFRTTPAMSDAYITDSFAWDGTRPGNYQGTLEDVLTSLFVAGSASAGTNQPLGAIKSVVETPNGFFRRDSYGAYIVVTASDDASPDLDYVHWLKNAYNDPTNAIVSGVYAQPAPHLDTFFNSFPNRASIVSLDNSDWSDAYALLGQLIRTPLSTGVRCAPKPIDVDPQTAGEQFDAHIAYVVNDREVPMTECVTGGPRPCWSFIRDIQQCFEDYYLFVIDGFPGPYHPEIRGEYVVK
jgi:hypothetical protein